MESWPEGKVFEGWVLTTTRDGSPSLSRASLHADERHELMHHRGGAWSESCYIYQPPIRWAFATQDQPSILSLGLGLGYLEVLTAIEALRTGKNFTLTSFESAPELRSHFLSFVQGQSVAPWESVYSEIFARAEVDGRELKTVLLEAYRDGRWQLREGLSQESDLETHKYHAFLWDAFSTKTSPELWSEEFMAQVFARHSHHKSWVSTYACNGALKRALAAAGFEVHVRPGFEGKRQCTWGLKCVSLSEESLYL